jgi:hypothetical protein
VMEMSACWLPLTKSLLTATALLPAPEDMVKVFLSRLEP